MSNNNYPFQATQRKNENEAITKKINVRREE